MSKEFSPSEQRELLAFVRAVIAAEFQNTEPPAAPALPQLSERRSCFVTLHDAAGNLRGCIGNIEAFEPLAGNLSRNACNAAFSDPRFPPLEPDELAETRIELSILTPVSSIEDPTQFTVGVDGIIMRQGVRGAVFLPQVPQEQGWDQVTTLEYLSRKAGFAPDGRKEPGTIFQTFRAEVFGE